MLFQSLCLVSVLPLMAQNAPSSVTKVEGYKDVFHYGRAYVAGQPSLELLRALKAQGVTLVVNLREEKEVKEHAATGFQVEAVVKELGMTYLWLPLGEKGSYTPAALERLGQAVKATPGKVLIHCASGGRASTLFVAHLVRHGGSSLDEAVAIGKQMKFTLPLEDLLGAPISMQAK